MEGPLSKWTNMVHGWQYRWFKIENDTLLYYTSREKMLKGQQRGKEILVSSKNLLKIYFQVKFVLPVLWWV